MANRVLVWAAASPKLQRQVIENPIARRAAHRWVFDTPANWRKIICGNTVDAADEALIEAGNAVWDLSGLVIGSGDGAFTDLVTSAQVTFGSAPTKRASASRPASACAEQRSSPQAPRSSSNASTGA